MLLLSLSIAIGIRKPQEPGRIIFLSDGRKVCAPLKPERLAISYSIVHETEMDYPTWFQYIRMGGNQSESNLIRKWYL